MDRSRCVISVLCVITAVTGACGGERGPVPTPAGVPAEAVTCTTLSDDCYLPFPTNLFTEAAPSPTGLELAIRAENFPTPITADVLRTYPPELLDANDGWLRKRFDTFMNERCKGKDATKLRFVIE